MIEIDSLIVVFMIEGLVAGLLFFLATIIFRFSRRSKEREAASQLITHINESAGNRSQNLTNQICESCGFEQNEIADVINEVSARENSLYKKLISIFLNRDTSLLNGVDSSVQSLSEPLCQLMSKMSEKSRDNPELLEAMEAAKSQIEGLKNECQELGNECQGLKTENERLAKQLAMAMETTDEISMEYTRIFGSSREAEELDMSRKRMLNTFLRAEESMAKVFSASEESEEISI